MYQYLFRPPNYWDKVLREDERIWNEIQRRGGIEAVVSPFRHRLLRVGNWGEPWMRATSEATPFQYTGSIPLPAAGAGDQLVTNFVVPVGYDGVITGITHFATGVGFEESSGDLTWRLRVNRRWAQSLGAMTTSMGSVAQPSPLTPGGIRILSRQLIQYFVNNAVGSHVAGGRIVCTISGRFYPEQ